MTKSNIFEHIFYEFEMYLYSYSIMTDNQFFNNMIHISHFATMRNIMEFFDIGKYNKKIF